MGQMRNSHAECVTFGRSVGAVGKRKANLVMLDIIEKKEADRFQFPALLE